MIEKIRYAGPCKLYREDGVFKVSHTYPGKKDVVRTISHKRAELLEELNDPHFVNYVKRLVLKILD